MSHATKEILEAFAREVKWLGAGSLTDQERLLDFIIAAYRNGDHHITQEEFLDTINLFDEQKKSDTTTAAQKKHAAVNKLYAFQKYEEGVRLLKKAGLERS